MHIPNILYLLCNFDLDYQKTALLVLHYITFMNFTVFSFIVMICCKYCFHMGFKPRSPGSKFVLFVSSTTTSHPTCRFYHSISYYDHGLCFCSLVWQHSILQTSLILEGGIAVSVVWCSGAVTGTVRQGWAVFP